MIAMASCAVGSCAAWAQGSERPLGFLDDLFGNSERFASPSGYPQDRPPPTAPSSQAPAGPQRRVAQVPGAEVNMRIDRLESQIRQLTGAIEQLQYRNQQLEALLRRMQGQDPARPTATQPQIQPQQTRPQQTPPQQTPPYQVQPQQPQQAPPAAGGRRGDVFDPAQNPNAPGAPRVLGTLPAGPGGGVAQSNPGFEDGDVGAPGGRPAGAPRDLSTLAGAVANDRSLPQPGVTPSEPPQRAPGNAGAQVATLPPSDNPRDYYDLAYGYVLRKDYALAENGFRAFLQRFPGERLVPDAQYGLGESLFQRQRYRDAAEMFLAVSTKFDTHARAPDALLRLGQSLAAMGEREAACASLAEVMRKYPRASVAVRQGVDREQKRVRCS
jgi:tol-pal system protein YbgF